MAYSELKKNFTKTPGKFHVLVCCSGSVATLNFPTLVSKIRDDIAPTPSDIEIRVITTESARHFFNPTELDVMIYQDQDWWDIWHDRPDQVLHIELRKWADLMIITPLCANTLAKLANGLCDNLLTCVARAWDFNKPIAFASAMNTYMWEHPITGKQISFLKELGYKEIPCIVKKLACGDTGNGGMAEVDTIVEFVKQEFIHFKDCSLL